jgi:hypothetical protein
VGGHVEAGEPRATAPAAPSLGDFLRADIGGLQRAFNRPGGRASLAYRFIRALLSERRGHLRYRMKVLYFPPLGLIRGGRANDDPSAAACLHAFYLGELWRERGPWARLRLLVALCAWPFVTLGTLAWFTWLDGDAIERRTGKSRARQMSEQLWLAAAHDVLPPWYYVFELFDDSKRRRAHEYLHRFETKGGLLRFVKRNHGGERTPLSDKLEFSAWCASHRIPTIPVLLAARKGEFLPEYLPGKGRDPWLPAIDLFVKPTKGRGGTGAQLWCWTGEGRYVDVDGNTSTPAELLALLRRISQTGGCIVQPRLTNHPALADLCNGALSTVRVLTIENERGEYEVTHAVLRMAVGANVTVDNFHAGGIAARVDLCTGHLGRATDIGLRPDIGWCETHPDTHAKILGQRLPWWQETCDLARRAHAAFSDRIAIGWDIAILPEGPVVVEGNGGPDLDIIQRCCGEPIGSSRFGELLAHHLRRAAAERARAGAPGRSGGVAA